MLDEATGEGDDKQFYTITTEAGNVFYLIIDGKRDDNKMCIRDSCWPSPSLRQARYQRAFLTRISG